MSSDVNWPRPENFMDSRLIMLLHSLWASTILNFKFDIWAHKIVLDLQILAEGQLSDFQLVFEDVWGYCFASETVLPPHVVPLWEVAELTSIHYLSPRKIVGVDRNMLHPNAEVRFQANFLLKIWGSVLYINPKKVGVGKEVFDVGY